MSFGAVAGAAVGLIGASMASDAAGDAADKAAGSQQAQLDFQMQQYNDWKDIYGPMQEDIADYWKNVNGREMVAQEVQQVQMAQQEANTRIKETMAQRGISGSGLEAGLTNQNIFNTEIQKAMIRNTADERKIAGQTGLLSLGLSQGSQISAQMSGTSSALANTMYNAGAAQSNIITGATDTLGGVVGYGFDQYNPTNSAVPAANTDLWSQF